MAFNHSLTGSDWRFAIGRADPAVDQLGGAYTSCERNDIGGWAHRALTGSQCQN